MMPEKQLANRVRMVRVLYRKRGLHSTISFLNLSGINTLSTTVVGYNSKRDILVPIQRHVINSLH